MKNSSPPDKLEKLPGMASAENGYVFLDGPDGVAVTLTPDAAIATGESLIAAAKIARDQVESDTVVYL